MFESSHETTIDQCKKLSLLISKHTDSKGDGLHTTEINKLEFIRQSDTLTAMQNVSEPTLAIVVQGQKKVLLNEETYHYCTAQYLVISVDLPLCGYATEATTERPYLGFKLTLDPMQLCDLITQIRPHPIKQDNLVPGWFISDAQPSLINCAIRLTQLLDTPEDITFLAPAIIREIYYRLLKGEQGEAVRQVATFGSNMQRIAEAIKLIKTDFDKPMRIENLAEYAKMSSSSFYRHFKAVTSMSPLQYQKQIRLLKARHLMLAENADAANTAYQVGYESPSQFSREYSRMFGAPPIQDIERLRMVLLQKQN
ncbi:MAG: AraC family transcriptional regulator [Cyanobacteria bacterium P01_G01_bin.49]